MPGGYDPLMEDAELPPRAADAAPVTPPMTAEAGAFQPPLDDGSAMVPLAPAPTEPNKSKKGLLLGVASLAVHRHCSGRFSYRRW